MSDERKIVTALFADGVGSSATGSQRDPETRARGAGQFFARMKTIGRAVEKYFGDAVVPVFDMPRLHEDDAVRALNLRVNVRCSTMT